MNDEGSLIGCALGGYQILREIGRGGMGVVYRARDVGLQRDVALKVLARHLASDASFVTRFLREGQAAARMSHPNLVHMYAVGEQDGRYYMAMELVNGLPLSAYIRLKKQLDVRKALFIAREVAKALAEAHRHQIIHRDIKPDNILIDPLGRVKVTDFGLARATDDLAQITAHGTIVGTPQYMSPEQVKGEPTDARTDIYSLGITLFEMLAGEPPFKAPSHLSAMYQIIESPLPSISERNPEVSPPLAAIIARMCAKAPDERYAAALEVSQDLRTLLRGDRISGIMSEASTPVACEAGEPVQSHGVSVDDELRAELLQLPPPSHVSRVSAARIASAKLENYRGRRLLLMATGAIIAFGAYLTLRATPLLSAWPESIHPVTDVSALFRWGFPGAHGAIAGAFLVAWGLWFWSAARWANSSARAIIPAAILSAGLGYLTTWLPPYLMPAALGVVLIVTSLSLARWFGLRGRRLAIICAAGGVLAASALTLAYGLVEGLEAVQAFPAVAAYAWRHDGRPEAGPTRIRSMRVPATIDLEWKSTELPWLDRRGGLTFFDIAAPAEGPYVNVELRDADGTVFYCPHVEESLRRVCWVSAARPYTLVLTAETETVVDLTIQGILKAAVGEQEQAAAHVAGAP